MKFFQKERLLNKENPRVSRRYLGATFFGIIIVVFFIFIGRFSYIAIHGQINNNNLSQKTAALYRKDTVIKAKRGTIYDASGNAIAEDTTTYSVYAVLDKKYVNAKHKKLYVTDKQKVAKLLSAYLPMSQAKILKTLQTKNAFQVEFGTAGKNLSLAIKQKIEAAHLSGVYFTATPARLYPNGIFASHQIGLAQAASNSTDTTLKGVMGIEQGYNTILSGKNGSKQVDQDSYGYQLPDSKTKYKAAKNGSDIYLTLDSRLQSYLETLMTKEQKKFNPKSMTAVLMNPKTGQILAASQRPTFNPQTGAGFGSANAWRDILTEDSYEPGSVMKVFSLASIINAGKYPPNAYYQSGKITVGGVTVHDWNTTGWGSIPYSQAFPRSSNVGFVHLEQILGHKKWLAYLKKFKFLKATHSGLPGEASGSVQFGSAADQSITAFGQGINVTVMQMMQGFSAIANGGKEMKPQIISKVVNSQTGKTTTYQPQQVAKPVTKKTTKKVISAMRDVVNKKYGTGTAYKIKGQDIAVKTGTAQISGSNGYLTGSNNYIFSVVGMAPASNPKYVLYITMKQPQNIQSTDATNLSDIFKPMMTRALAYSNVTTTSSTESTATMKKLSGESVTKAKQVLDKQKLKPIQIGTGNTVVQQSPVSGTQLLSNQRVLLLTNGAMTMPDVSGWSKSDLLRLEQLTGKTFKITGTGYAKTQSLPANSLMNSAKTITVTLE
ncbi:penicillin-binding protein [Loigolactobacillus bifermentans]|jgi:penicillin-binding protein 2B|uniref:Bifunctional dimerization transpeptidase n=1 Tax=Loigolactobacillus bifermentans DSM 20003 TaxID=1423726 RepID=A0A0R1H1I1_9LACO|nr:penicillin-binding protein [Loigolactobacillus bifermentans]KRK40461.1 bifunctional dimerization transpeptidase [Loigolactobacillus bifermentans DSM 20003]QGG59816.1 PASTA domain-containing protein [Loigolactobacillus bifermentans]